MQQRSDSGRYCLSRGGYPLIRPPSVTRGRIGHRVALDGHDPEHRVLLIAGFPALETHAYSLGR
jgi:hypothetical protein